MLNPVSYVKWLGGMVGQGYLMGGVGEYTKNLKETSWLVTQYKGNAKQYAKAKYWLKNVERVFDCQGLSDCYVTEQTGKKTNVYARNNYDNWCSVKGTGKIPNKYKVPGAAVFIYSSGTGHITHVGYLEKPVKGGDYNGDWYVIEAKGCLYGVVRTKLSNGSWNRWGLMDKYFDYADVLKTYHPTNDTPKYNLGDRSIKSGMTGTDVEALQAVLIKLGYSNVKIDGFYGDATLAAVVDFKTRNSILTNGKATATYGTRAHAMLMEEIAKLDEQDAEPIEKKNVEVFEYGTWNVRKGAGTTYGILTVVKYGAVMPYVSTASNGWLQVEINGEYGWISPKCAKVV